MKIFYSTFTLATICDISTHFLDFFRLRSSRYFLFVLSIVWRTSQARWPLRSSPYCCAVYAQIFSNLVLLGDNSGRSFAPATLQSRARSSIENIFLVTFEMKIFWDFANDFIFVTVSWSSSYDGVSESSSCILTTSKGVILTSFDAMKLGGFDSICELMPLIVNSC